MSQTDDMMCLCFWVEPTSQPDNNQRSHHHHHARCTVLQNPEQFEEMHLFKLHTHRLIQCKRLFTRGFCDALDWEQSGQPPPCRVRRPRLEDPHEQTSKRCFKRLKLAFFKFLLFSNGKIFPNFCRGFPLVVLSFFQNFVTSEKLPPCLKVKRRETRASQFQHRPPAGPQAFCPDSGPP